MRGRTRMRGHISTSNNWNSGSATIPDRKRSGGSRLRNRRDVNQKTPDCSRECTKWKYLLTRCSGVCIVGLKHMISIANHKTFIRLRRDSSAYRAALAARGRTPHPATGGSFRFPLLQLASIPMHFHANSLPLRSSGHRFPGYSGLFRAIPATAKLSCRDLANQPRRRSIQPFIHRVNPT
jgi:hypothetical protein